MDSVSFTLKEMVRIYNLIAFTTESMLNAIKSEVQEEELESIWIKIGGQFGLNNVTILTIEESWAIFNIIVRLFIKYGNINPYDHSLFLKLKGILH